MLGLRSLRAQRYVAANTLHSRRLLRAGFATSPLQHATVQTADGKQERAQRERELRKAPLHFWVGLGFVLVLGFYSAQLLTAIIKAGSNDAPLNLAQQKDVAARYDEIADSFDSEVNFSEWLMGLLKERKRIAAKCIGNTLEVSCGTGRNLGYYEFDNAARRLSSLTLIDLSPQMINACKKKFVSLRAGKKKDPNQPNECVVRLIAASALGDIPPAPNGMKYDTIVQTMGLCSTSTPVELVVNMARHLELRNPNARIYLLEHGRSRYDWLNKIIDDTAAQHADQYGCWYNRDIDGLVAEAAQKSGFELVSAKRRHFGTTFIYELKPGPKAAEMLIQQDVVSRPEEPAVSTWKKWFLSSNGGKQQPQPQPQPQPDTTS